MKEISIDSPAKINLYLNVLDKRNDGYHNIETAFQYVGIYDFMKLRETKRGIKINAKEPYLSGLESTIYKSAEIIQKYTNKISGVEIDIIKNIPVGAGLGGGSSNAASTLVALNKLWNLDLSNEVLMKMGSSIGADVPFFIYGKNASGTGIGDQLKEIKPIDANILVISPTIHNSTKKMFDLLNEWRINNNIKYLSKQNHFWNIYIEENPEIKVFYDQVSEDNEINLSGSGSSMFILYKNKDKVEKILKKIPTNWRLFFCKPLQYSPICYIK